MFIREFRDEKIFIDEAQYAPALFPSLKRRVDLYKRDPNYQAQTIVRLTGSNQILMDRNIKESLAGRASFFDMTTLSVAEIVRARSVSIQDILYAGGWPEIHATSRNDVKKYLDDYINSYVEKDVVLAAGVQKRREFLKFVRLLAGRVGCILELSSLASETGVDSKTIKEWVSILMSMHIIGLVDPYSTNLTNRLVKAPKVYFNDTGFACRLQGWTSPEQILTSPQQGPLFENLVYAEISKINQNFQLGWTICHWRSRAGEEIDFLIEKSPNNFLFVEAKVSPVAVRDYTTFPEVRKVFGMNPPPLVVCHQEGEHVLGKYIPIRFLAEFLRQSGIWPTC